MNRAQWWYENRAAEEAERAFMRGLLVGIGLTLALGAMAWLYIRAGGM